MTTRTRDYKLKLKLETSGVLSEYKNTLDRMGRMEDNHFAKLKRKIERTHRSAKAVGGGGSTRPSSRSPFRSKRPRASENSLIDFNQSISDSRDKVSSANFTQDEAIQKQTRLLRRLNEIQQKTHGVRSRQRLAKQRSELRKINREMNELVRLQKDYNKSLNKGRPLIGKFTKSLTGIGLAAVSAYTILEVGKAAFHVGKEMDSMRAALQATADTSLEAEENFAFLKGTAQRLGRDITTSTSGFNRIAVAARGAGFNTEEAREIFLAASEASAAFSLDTQRSGLVMLAFSQIMSKGRVSMEELSRQLGENLPIAMKAAADSMGLTTGELIKQVETGKVLAKDFMLPFVRQIRQMSRHNGALAASQEKLVANQNRMNNAFKILVDDIFQKGGIAKVLSSVFKAIAKLVETLTPLIVSSFRVLYEVFKSISGFVSVFNEEVDESVRKLGWWERSFKSVALVVLAVAQGINYLTLGMQKLEELNGFKFDLSSTGLDNLNPLLKLATTSKASANIGRSILDATPFGGNSNTNTNNSKNITISNAEISVNGDNPDAMMDGILDFVGG